LRCAELEAKESDGFPECASCPLKDRGTSGAGFGASSAASFCDKVAIKPPLEPGSWLFFSTLDLANEKYVMSRKQMKGNMDDYSSV
jgi:hypothetical protein